MGSSQRRGRETDSVTVKTTTDYSGREQTWTAELRKYLTAYRSIPHNTTGRSPAELLFNWKVKGKIPDLSIDHAYNQEVHDRDAEQKAKSKAYADIHRRASPSSIELNDDVLVQQDKHDKTNKLSTAFNPNPFKVVSKTGKSLLVESPTGNQYSRNTSHVKQCIREGDPTPQQGSDPVSTPPPPPPHTHTHTHTSRS